MDARAMMTDPASGGVSNGSDVDVKAVGRKVGYVVSIGVNLFGLWVVDNIEGWHVTRFLTSAFDQVVPYLIGSIVVAIVGSLVSLVWDRPAVRSGMQLLALSASVVALGRMLQVFPVDFADYAVDWSVYLRVGLFAAVVGTVIGALVELGRFFRALG